MVLFLNTVTAGIATSDGSWVYQSTLSSAAAVSNSRPSLGSAANSIKNSTNSNVTSICSVASVRGTLTIQTPCHPVPKTNVSSAYTKSHRTMSNTTLSRQATATAKSTSSLERVNATTTATSSAMTLGMSTAQTSPSATSIAPSNGVTPLPTTQSTQSRQSLLRVASGASANQIIVSSGMSSFSATSSSAAIPFGSANASQSNASLALETKEMQNQLAAAIMLTQTWVNKSTGSNSDNAVNAINGTILFAQVWTRFIHDNIID